jgi:hypothetical protein
MVAAAVVLVPEVDEDEAVGEDEDEHADATRATDAPAQASAASLLRFKTIPPLEGNRTAPV